MNGVPTIRRGYMPYKAYALLGGVPRLRGPGSQETSASGGETCYVPLLPHMSEDNHVADDTTWRGDPVPTDKHHTGTFQ